MAPAIPEFGTAAPGATYVLRPGGYVVIFSAGGEVVAVSTPVGLALPGERKRDRESFQIYRIGKDSRPLFLSFSVRNGYSALVCSMY